MIVLIIGYPDSGKSKIAEDIAVEMSSPGGRIYLATMIPYGEEGSERIAKHRAMREGKGFVTIEAPFDVAETLERAAAGGMLFDIRNKTVLLECLSNLVANELFERHADAAGLTEKTAADILRLSEMTENLVIVSNHFEITEDFDEETRLYAEVMDKVNDRVAAFADKVIKLSS